MKKNKKEAKPEAKPETKPEAQAEAKPEEAKVEKAEKKKADGESPALAKYLVELKKRRPTLPGDLVKKLRESKTKGVAQRGLRQYLRDNNVA
jgi:hypothetical protein